MTYLKIFIYGWYKQTQKTILIKQILESGLSDFHKLVVSVLKSYFKKEDPKVVIEILCQ